MRRFNLTRTLRRFLRAEGGATSIEYAMIASGVSIAIVTVLTTLGETIQTVFYDKLSNLF